MKMASPFMRSATSRRSRVLGIESLPSSKWRGIIEFAAGYLRAALEDDDEAGVLLIALRRIAEARGGIAKVAKAAGIERESLYRALSRQGNPRLSTLVAVTKAVGLKLTVEEAG